MTVDSRDCRTREWVLEPEAWKHGELPLAGEAPVDDVAPFGRRGMSPEDRRELFDLLSQVNFRILRGERMYLRARGVAHRILYGGYWRSIHTGAEHYLLRCAEIEEGIWLDGGGSANEIDLTIRHASDGWVITIP